MQVEARWSAAHRLCALAALILLVLASAGCYVMCPIDVTGELGSPDGRSKAVVFVRTCGTTVRDVTSVSIISANSTVNRASTANILTVRDRVHVRMEWKSERLLLLSIPKQAVVGTRVSQRAGIRIIYSTYDEDER